MKDIIICVTLISLLLIAFMAISHTPVTKSNEQDAAKEHVYASWETMEFDKCVAAWLIVRFLDPEAEFVFFPKGTEITEGIVFDVPGADWSRKHRRCTSQCIWDSINKPDPAALFIFKNQPLI